MFSRSLQTSKGDLQHLKFKRSFASSSRPVTSLDPRQVAWAEMPRPEAHMSVPWVVFTVLQTLSTKQRLTVVLSVPPQVSLIKKIQRRCRCLLLSILAQVALCNLPLCSSRILGKSMRDRLVEDRLSQKILLKVTSLLAKRPTRSMSLSMAR